MIGHDPRKTVRMPRYLGAKIEFNNKQSIVDCVVRNQSRGGALLRLETPVDLPPSFELSIARHETRYRCELVWSRARLTGVRFEQQDETPRRPHLRPVA